jgi:hypothetical protein
MRHCCGKSLPERPDKVVLFCRGFGTFPAAATFGRHIMFAHRRPVETDHA